MPVQEVNVFDNLSKTLAGHASQLPTDEQEKELEIRRALVESLGNFDEDRTELAKNLIEYKQVFKSQRQWTRVVNEIGTAIQVSARTVFRLIEDFERAQKGGESDTMPDFSLIAGDRLSKEERLFIRARLAIRSVLNEVPNNRKQQAIADVLAEEAYQIWGARSPILLEVSPKPSRFTIDGRKRTVSTNEKEEEQ
jgi:predicted XRE-type DNA-binding protein